MIHHLKYIIIGCLFIFSCKAKEPPTQFSESALNDVFTTIDGQNVIFKNVLNNFKGKKILIDVWATWCKDCIEAMPKVKDLQDEFPEVIYLFLSVDKTTKSWANGIEKYAIKGTHYFIQSGWDGDFCNFLDLDWIPRYLIINEQGEVALFRATEANDIRIKNILK